MVDMKNVNEGPHKPFKIFLYNAQVMESESFEMFDLPMFES